MESLSSLVADCVVDTEPYVYKSLPHGDCFRYLMLEPGTGSEPLRCSIHTSTIPDANYEAISYVWGSEIKDQRIYCDNHTIHITTNLFQALQRLRSSTDVRALWADSVCINQEDLEEKGHQVSIMGLIYSSATRVLIYIGSDPGVHGSEVASLLYDMTIHFNRKISELRLTNWDSFPFSHRSTDCHLTTDMRWQSVSVLVQQQWFKRGWVVQEAGLTRQSLIVWGSFEFPWAALMHVCAWTVGREVLLPSFPRGYMYQCLGPHVDAYMDRHLHTIRTFLIESLYKPTRVLDFFARGRRLTFKDQRDSIYACLGLPTDAKYDLKLLPDYSHTPEEVFRAAAGHYLDSTGDITILNYVIHDTASMQSDLPSWVPRWNPVALDCDPEFWRVASQHLQDFKKDTEPRILKGGILKVRGTVLDTIMFLSVDLRESTTTLKFIRRLWQNIRARSRQRRQSASQIFEDFFKTLVQHKWVGVLSEPYQLCLSSYFRCITQTQERDYNLETIESVHSLVRTSCNAKRFMVTTRGIFGHAPIVAQEGDTVAELTGRTRLPDGYVYLLRSTNRDNLYKFLGPGWASTVNINSFGAVPSEENTESDTEFDAESDSPSGSEEKSVGEGSESGDDLASDRDCNKDYAISEGGSVSSCRSHHGELDESESKSAGEEDGCDDEFSDDEEYIYLC